MEEIWKDIPGYEGSYQVSDRGRVKSLKRVFLKRNNIPCLVNEKILSPSYGGNGYPSVNLWRNKTYKTFLIHRLKAICFIPNPNNLTELNHKNGIKTDFSTANLEWCTHKENMMHAVREGLIKHKTGNFGKLHQNSKPVLKYSKDGLLIGEYDSISCASRDSGIAGPDISRVCLGKSKSAGGYLWKHKTTE